MLFRSWTKRLSEAYSDLKGVESHRVASCEACMRSKMRKTVVRSPPTRPARRPLERIHFDLAFFSTPGISDQKGFLMIVDEFTRMYFAYYFRNKSDVPDILKNFKAMAEKHFSETVGVFAQPELSSMRSDNDSVVTSQAVQEWCKSEGIEIGRAHV